MFQMGNLMEGTSIWVGLIISDYAIIYDVPPCKESLLLKVIKESLLAGWRYPLALFDLELKLREISLNHLKVIPQNWHKGLVTNFTGVATKSEPADLSTQPAMGKCSCLQIDRRAKMGETYTWSRFCFQSGRALTFEYSA